MIFCVRKRTTVRRQNEQKAAVLLGDPKQGKEEKKRNNESAIWNVKKNLPQKTMGGQEKGERFREKAQQKSGGKGKESKNCLVKDIEIGGPRPTYRDGR